MKNLVGRGVGKGSGGNSDTAVGSVEDAVEAFQKSLAFDEPKPGIVDRPNVSDDEINTVRIAAYQSIQGTLQNPYESKPARASRSIRLQARSEHSG